MTGVIKKVKIKEKSAEIHISTSQGGVCVIFLKPGMTIFQWGDGSFFIEVEDDKSQ